MNTNGTEDPGCYDCGNVPTYAANGEGQRLCATDAGHAQVIGEAITWDEDAPQNARQTPVVTAWPTRCAYCHLAGPAGLFAVIRRGGGSLACKATAACQVRQSGDSAAYVLDRLLRAVRAELVVATPAELAVLAVTLEGYPDDVLGWLRSSVGGAAALFAEKAARS